MNSIERDWLQWDEFNLLGKCVGEMVADDDTTGWTEVAGAGLILDPVTGETVDWEIIDVDDCTWVVTFVVIDFLLTVVTLLKEEVGKICEWTVLLSIFFVTLWTTAGVLWTLVSSPEDLLLLTTIDPVANIPNKNIQMSH